MQKHVKSLKFVRMSYKNSQKMIKSICDEDIEIEKPWKLFTIGNMIEILEKKSLKFDINKKYDTISERFEGWNVHISYIAKDKMHEIESIEYELCDALWYVLRQLILNKKKVH